MKEFAKNINALFYQTSAKSSTGIKDLFTGIVLKYTGWKGNVIFVDNNNGNQSEKYSRCSNLDTSMLRNKKNNKKKKCC